MRWGELREGDVLLCENGRVWLILECKPHGRGSTAWSGSYPLVWLKTLDLQTGKVWATPQNDSREGALREDQVLRAICGAC